MGADRLKELLGNIPWGALLAAFLAYLAYDYYSFNNSPDSPLLQKQAQIEAIKKDNAGLQVKIRQASEFFRTLESKKDELRGLAQQLSEMKGTLSTQIDISEFMKLVVTEAKKVGLSVTGLKPGDGKSKEYYAEQPFDMTFRGVYVQFLVFLDRISSVQNIVRVEQIAMHPVGAVTSKYVELEGVLQLKTYRYLGTKADEISVARDDGGGKSGGSKPAGGKSGGTGGGQ